VIAVTEHFYLISYDVRNDRRLRKMHKLLRGYGEWLQLSVFHCRLSRQRLVRLEAAVRELLDLTEDHVLFVDLGGAEPAASAVKSLGRTYEPPQRRPVIV